MEVAFVGPLTSIGLEAEKRTEGFLRHHLKYITRYKKNVEEFQSWKKDLEDKEKDLEKQVEVARRNLEDPTNAVRSWLDKSKEIISECEKIDKRIRESTRRRCSWYTYKLSRKAVKMEDKLRKHLEKCHFNEIVLPHPPLPGIFQMHTWCMEGLNSAEETKLQVMEALNMGVSVIGVYGMGGVGKTTLMQSINNDMMTKWPDLFTYVIMVTVTSNPDIKKMQDDIASRLGLELKDNNMDHRANVLLRRLNEEKKVLIILDDVWEKLDMGVVGIPCGNVDGPCKIVITTRKEDVCMKMNARSIPMNCLTEEESWLLFKSIAGEIADMDDIRTIAKEVCKECAGLPLAISVVGSSLHKEDKEYIWSESLFFLKNSRPDGLEKLEKEVFNPLKLSYDRLHREDLRFCFLFCCLFPEDHVIHVSDLMYYGIGEGFLTSEMTLLHASLALLRRLKICGLLLDVENHKMLLRMHDVVRDMAIFIATKDERYGFCAKAGMGLTEWSLEQEQGWKRISLMGNNIKSLHHQPRFCQGIKSLLLRDNIDLKVLPHNFFTDMQDLLILDLRNTSLSTLPPSICKLINLRVLMFSNVNRGKSYINMICLLTMKSLSVLCLQRTIIPELPEAIVELVHLRVLDLSDTFIEIIKPNVLSKLSQLEELRMHGSFYRWEAADEHGCLAPFIELVSLKRLYVLEVDVDNKKILAQDMDSSFWGKLSYFSIYASILNGQVNVWDVNLVALKGSVPFAGWLKILMKKTTNLLLDQCQGLFSFHQLLEEPEQPSDYDFCALRCLHICWCDDVEELKLHGMSNLETLKLMFMRNLKALTCCVLSTPLLFSKLRRLVIIGCDKLTGALLKPTLVNLLHNLEEVMVADCRNLKGAVESSATREAVVRDHQHQDVSLLPKLAILNLFDLWQFEKIVLSGTVNSLPNGSFQCLGYIHIDGCEGLRSAFSWSTALCLAQLIRLVISWCPALEEIIGTDASDQVHQVHKAHVFPMLSELKLSGLPRLGSVCRGRQALRWASLRTVVVHGCKELKNLCLGEESAPDLKTLLGEEEWFQKLAWDSENSAKRFHALYRSD